MVNRHQLIACCLALLGIGSGGICVADGRGDGIWKAAVPPAPMQGEFDSLDPLGVAAGARIKADCSLNWIDPDDGKRYCFSSGTSLEFFLDEPRANLERARAGWRSMISRCSHPGNRRRNHCDADRTTVTTLAPRSEK